MRQYANVEPLPAQLFQAPRIAKKIFTKTTAAIGGPASYSNFGTPGSDGSKYLLGLSRSGRSPILDNSTLRQNARKAYHDSVAARALVDRYADSVVDTGLRLEAAPIAELVGVTPEVAEQWAANVERAFHLWASSKKATRAENMTFYQAQRLAEISQTRDGEYFSRFFYTKFKNGQNPLQIGFLDPGQIRGDAYTSTYGFQCDEDGIERDATGREIAYLVWARDAKGEYKPKRIPALGAKSKRRIMIHGYAPEYAGQGRGYSRISHALQEFADLTTFKISQIKKAIAQSSLTMVNEPSDDAAASNPFQGIQHNLAAGPAVEPSDDAPIENDGASIGGGMTYELMPEATIVQPGSVGVFNLQPGEKLKPFDSTLAIG